MWVLQLPHVERVFQLSLNKVSCDGGGLSIGGVAPLENHLRDANARIGASAQSSARLRTKSGLQTSRRHLGESQRPRIIVAQSLARGEIALAQIATLLLRFPDPLPLNKKAWPGEELGQLAQQLIESGLLRGDWDPSAHPRTGTPPNRGWFASKPRELKPARPDTGWPSSAINRAAREWIARAVESVAEDGSLLVDSLPLAKAIIAFFDGLGLGPAGEGEDRLSQQLLANYIRPKTLDELQTPPTINPLGYEQHHISRAKNPGNFQKGCALSERLVTKFGQDLIDTRAISYGLPPAKAQNRSRLITTA